MEAETRQMMGKGGQRFHRKLATNFDKRRLDRLFFQSSKRDVEKSGKNMRSSYQQIEVHRLRYKEKSPKREANQAC